MKTHIVYKIFRRDSYKLVSWSPPVGCSFHYTIGKWNEPKIDNSRFFCFKNKGEALSYDFEDKSREVWLCHAVGLKKIKARVDIARDALYVKEFWNGNLKGFYVYYCEPYIFGARLIKPIKKIA